MVPGTSTFQPSESANTTTRGTTSNGASCSTHSPQKVEVSGTSTPTARKKRRTWRLELVEHVERTSSVAQNDVCGGFRCPSLGLWWQVPFPPLSAALVHPCTDRSRRPHCPTQCVFFFHSAQLPLPSVTLARRDALALSSALPVLALLFPSLLQSV